MENVENVDITYMEGAYKMSNFGFYNIIEEKTYIEDIPIIVLTPKGVDNDLATIVLYHGWSSSKETQRIRGFILSSVGYRVVIPDSINHGERDPFSHYGIDKGDELWVTALRSIDEWPILIRGLIKKYNINKDKIGVIGNSMGGIIASGIYTHNDYIKGLVVLNGTMAWENTNSIVKGLIKNVIEDLRKNEIKNEYKDVIKDLIKDAAKIPIVDKIDKIEEIENRVEIMDPIKNIDLLKSRPILLLHGDADEVVSIESQRLFYNTIMPKYDEKEKIKFVEYPGLNHIVSTKMMEEAIIFFNKYIK